MQLSVDGGVMLGQVLFIVWRESVEALLVIGILYAWLRTNPGGERGLRYLWGGRPGGRGGGPRPRRGHPLVQLLLRRRCPGLLPDGHGAHRRGPDRPDGVLDAQEGPGLPAQSGGRASGTPPRPPTGWGSSPLVALAVMREGSEMVIFLYGLGLTERGLGLLRFAGHGRRGLAARRAPPSGRCSTGGRRLSWRLFFRLSEAALLLLAAALLVTGLEKMEAFGWLPSLKDQVWNSAWLLDDSGRIGAIVASLTGYRAQPSLLILLLYGLYWVAIAGVMKAQPSSGKDPGACLSLAMARPLLCTGSGGVSCGKCCLSC